MLLLLAPVVPEPAGAWAAKQLAVGNGHSCALTKAGGVLCWGQNDQGQTGDGSGLPQPAPVAVSGLESGVAAIAAAGAHACAVTDAGAALCWGYNQSGQLGDGTTTRRFVPTPVSGLASGVAAIAAGIFHTCALTDAGGVLCWGRNTQGQLGNGTNTQSLVPAPVSGLASGVAAIRAGLGSTCALTDAGGVLCWGSLPGNGTGSSNVPVTVDGLASGVSSIAVGYDHACAHTDGGEVQCWGDNQYQQLGDHPAPSSSVPVTVGGVGASVGLLTAGGYHTCFDGGRGVGVQCWGDTNFDPLNYDAGPHSPTPVPVGGLPDRLVSLATGYEHACVAARDGSVRCWGSNSWGALGNGRTYRHVEPTPSVPTSGVTRVAAADDHGCAVWNGGAWCWGTDLSSELGIGHPGASPTGTPRLVAGLASGVTDVATSREHSCAVAYGAALCWGSDVYGQLGDAVGFYGFESPDPLPVSGLESGVVDAATGDYHSCAALGSGEVRCWGSNESWQLGDGTTMDRETPVAVVGLSGDVSAISAAAFFTCALTVGATVECWGSGWLGDGAQSSGGPVPVAGLSNVDAIATGEGHACALSQGVVSCWGRNNYGQLGDGTTTDRGLPTPVSGLPPGIVAIAAGDDHSCAATSSETFCWGNERWGQLGIGSLGDYQLLPASVSGAPGNVVALAAGARHSCATLADGSLHCWGDNEQLQLGNGQAYLFETPDVVVGFEVASVPALGPAELWLLAAGLAWTARRRLRS